jgi:hypothetical protein
MIFSCSIKKKEQNQLYLCKFYLKKKRDQKQTINKYIYFFCIDKSNKKKSIKIIFFLCFFRDIRKSQFHVKYNCLAFKISDKIENIFNIKKRSLKRKVFKLLSDN